jgi:hypothetical protein
MGGRRQLEGLVVYFKIKLILMIGWGIEEYTDWNGIRTADWILWTL